MIHPVRRILLCFALPLLVSSPLLASIQGTLITQEGAAISGGSVMAYAPETEEARYERWKAGKERTALATATSDSKGNFTLDVKAPVVTVVAQSTGFAPRSLLAGMDEALGPIDLLKAAMKQGRVTAKGKPVEGASIILRGSAEIVARTGADGTYTVPDPELWRPSILILHPDFAPLREDRLGGRGRKLEHALSPGVKAGGIVVAQDGKTPVAKAKILFDRDGSVTETRDDGTFEVNHAPADWKQVRAIAGDRIGATQRAEGTLRIKLSRGATLTGTVRDAKSQKPVSSASVSLRTRRPGENPYESFADAKGSFTVGPILPGSYSVWTQVPGYREAEVDLDLKAGETLNKVIYLEQSASVAGVVSDEDKRGIPGALVTAGADDSGRGGGPFRMQRVRREPSRTGPDGKFVVRSAVPDTSLILAASKKGLPSATSSPVKLAAGERKSNVLIVIPRGISVEGKVVDSAGRPIAGVAVNASEAEAGGANRFMIMLDGGAPRDVDVVRTGADGTFALQLKEGKYDLSFQSDSYARKRMRGYTVSGRPEPIEVVLEPGSEISGRVIRADGSGVADARVSVFGPNQPPGEPAVTGPDGAFTIGNLEAGPTMIVVFKPEESIRENQPVTAPIRDLIIQLKAGGKISGRVIDKSTGNPITDFQAGLSGTRGGGGMVMVMPPNLRPFRSDDGAFILENLPAGQGQLIVRAPGYVEAKVPGLRIEEGKMLSDVEVALETGVRLTGKVTGPEGTPLSAVEVESEGEDLGMPMRMRMPGGISVSTDPTGEYTLESLAPGEKTFIFSKEGYVSERKSIKLSGQEARLDVRLSRGRPITGMVVTEAGAPVGGANVFARSAQQDSSPRSARTEANGEFQFDGLVPGRYTFTASKSGFASGELRDIDINTAGPLRIVLKTGAVISGRVTGLPPSELSSTSVSASSSEGNARAAVDFNGTYRIEGAPTGTVRVVASYQSMVGFKSAEPKTIEVSSGSEHAVDLQFDSGAVIRGRVTQVGHPSSNARVTFSPKDPSVQTRGSATTDRDGVYEVSGLADGEYRVSVLNMERMSNYETEYRVASSANFDIDMKATGVRGRVIDAETSEPIVEASVSLTKSGASGAGGFFGPGTLTDSSGVFVVEPLAPGDYRVRASKTDYGQQSADVTVSDGSTSDVEIRIHRNDGLGLRVFDARDGRALDANVVVRDGQNRTSYTGMPRPGGDGVMRVPLAPGTYRVTVEAMDYAPSTVTVTSPAREVRIGLTPGGALEIQSRAASRQVGRLMSSMGEVSVRRFSPDGKFGIDPGTTTLRNIAPGPYTLQILDGRGQPETSQTVTVREGQVERVTVN